MYCKKCGAEIAENAKFCGGCGTAVEAVPVQPENTPEAYSIVKESYSIAK